MQHSLNWVQGGTHPWHGGPLCASLSSTERLHYWEDNLNRPEGGEERERETKCVSIIIAENVGDYVTIIYVYVGPTCMQLMRTPMGRMGSKRLMKREGDTEVVVLRVG